MSETSSKQNDKSSSDIESPKESDELGTEDLDKVAGGMMPNVGLVAKKIRLSSDPCEGGE